MSEDSIPRSAWLGLALLSQDEADYAGVWGELLDEENFERLDREVILSGPYADRPERAPYDGAKYHATDVNAVFTWDDDDDVWHVLNTGTADDPIPETTHFETVDVDTLAFGGEHPSVDPVFQRSGIVPGPEYMEFSADPGDPAAVGFDDAFLTPPEVWSAPPDQVTGSGIGHLRGWRRIRTHWIQAIDQECPMHVEGTNVSPHDARHSLSFGDGLTRDRVWLSGPGRVHEDWGNTDLAELQVLEDPDRGFTTHLAMDVSTRKEEVNGTESPPQFRMRGKYDDGSGAGAAIDMLRLDAALESTAGEYSVRLQHGNDEYSFEDVWRYDETGQLHVPDLRAEQVTLGGDVDANGQTVTDVSALEVAELRDGTGRRDRRFATDPTASSHDQGVAHVDVPFRDTVKRAVLDVTLEGLDGESLYLRLNGDDEERYTTIDYTGQRVEDDKALLVTGADNAVGTIEIRSDGSKQSNCFPELTAPDPETAGANIAYDGPVESVSLFTDGANEFDATLTGYVRTSRSEEGDNA